MPHTTLPRRVPALMLQGCSSNAGKSVLAAAFCRMLLQDGHAVAPFKAQNMSLNSYVTLRGEELGRAQATQAMACRLEPDARMNPVLLKPSSSSGSQVILMGKPVGHMKVADYIQFKPTAFETVTRAYDELAAEHEVMVIEGAGSPAEINLKSHDIVNMAVARHARATVLLVGDIDRGGVFAHFVGTLALLPPDEREMIAGLLINRFRGDASLLAPAFPEMHTRTGKDVLGVVPYVQELGLPEEDSVTFKEGGRSTFCVFNPLLKQGKVVVALVDLPHISNFTDMDALRLEPDVLVQTARHPEDLAGADVILLPGTKSTAADLAWLRQSGLAEAIRARAADESAVIVGICGGLQMLGELVDDPDGVESGPAQAPAQGLALLPLRTAMGREKILRRVLARHVDTNLPVDGYEIHHGVTTFSGTTAAGEVLEDIVDQDGRALGWGQPGNLVWGTYLHGVFDADRFRRWFLDRIRQRKGLTPLGKVMQHYSIDPALDRLADVVRAHVDWPRIKQLMGL
ncbi:putative cobyric acid synthase [Megalodesulfovibrio gigas DSM 1382 = ATCC 19364]|uniref:Cobyric acid synthase n=1 Tax=Megalodesulfovibrio gigas (strain ATCC 19364 / DSM 1382 / NCIMB 9332 / VKM B-1759) TaxID=1121448 RepID=T2GE83_MEGG1|nr:cobyric acid synthase [Megalodesulfovibrio gigas]AGW14910.1 putative cobyric acid synthase [Megalodesulfovibrio gigas DSM 1382 = ATCC 19364]